MEEETNEVRRSHPHELPWLRSSPFSPAGECGPQSALKAVSRSPRWPVRHSGAALHHGTPLHQDTTIPPTSPIGPGLSREAIPREGLDGEAGTDNNSEGVL